MNWMKRLWRDEPVIVRTVLSVAVGAGLIGATDAAAWGDAIAALVALLGPASARAKVTPTSNTSQTKGANRG